MRAGGGSGWRGWAAGCLALLLLPASGAGLGQAAAGADADGTMTLHVYENLIQVPVLVLTTKRGPIAPIAAERFAVSLDSGPRFRATHVRREGDDPLALAVVLDGVSLGDAGTQTAAAAVLALGDGGGLRAADSVGIYTRGCRLQASLRMQPGTKEGVARALAGGLPGGRPTTMEGCHGGITLWDSLAYVESVLREQAGRRVVIVLTRWTEPGRGRYTEREIWRYAGGSAITIFGVTGPDRREPEEGLGTLCASSGGAMLRSEPERFAATLKQLLVMLRGRYIVEFPRASNATAGLHDLRVLIEHGEDLVVRSSGTVVPLPSAEEIASPETVPKDLSRAPVMGARRPADSH